MRDYAYADYFYDSSIEKQVTITWDSGELTNEDLYAEEMTLTESLNSGTQLDFGSCEASSFEFKSSNTSVDLTGKEITVKIAMVIDGSEVTPLTLGVYTVYEDTLSGNRSYRTIKAYDVMYDLINADVMEWYQDLDFSEMTLKDFRDSFFEYMGVEQETTTLVNDSMSVEQTVLGATLSGKDVLHAICEINGCFGTIRQGVFYYVTLPYCSVDTAVTQITKNQYTSCEYSDYVIKTITGLKIIGNTTEDEDSDEDSDSDTETTDYYIIIASGDNQYVVNDNFLLYQKTDTEIISIGQKMFNVIYEPAGIRPCTLETVGNPCFELGDAINIIIGSNRYQNINTCILQRTLKGIQALTDTFKADGEEKVTFDTNSTSDSLKRLWGQTQALLSDVSSKGVIVITGTNEDEITVTSTETTVIELTAYSQIDAIPIYIGTIPFTSTTDGEATITTYIDDVEHIKITGQVFKGDNFMSLTDNFTIGKSEQKKFKVTMYTQYYETDKRIMDAKIDNLITFAQGGEYSSTLNIDGTVPELTIADSTVVAEIFLQGGATADLWNGVINVSDTYEGISYGNNYTAPATLIDSVDASVIYTGVTNASDIYTGNITYANNYTISTANYSAYPYIERGGNGLWIEWAEATWADVTELTWSEMADTSYEEYKGSE